MKRREFLGYGLTGSAMIGSSSQDEEREDRQITRPDVPGRSPEPTWGRPSESWLRVAPSREDHLTTHGYPISTGYTFRTGEVVIESDAPGQPHKGKVLAAIQPHSDDIPLFAAGTVAKLLKEGYTGYLIRTSNDEVAGPGNIPQTIMANHQDNQALGSAMGFRGVFDLGYRNHRMDEMSLVEFRARLIYLFRALKIDTIISYDPWPHYDYHPDHYVTARAVESAAFMAGNRKNYPEQIQLGLEAHGVRERYYFSRGRPQPVNRVVDISSVIDEKVEANLTNKAQGPAGDRGAELRRRLAAEGKKLPILGDDDETANRNYTKHVVLAYDRFVGQQYGVEYAEKFHYIGPSDNWMDRYVEDNTVPL